jgi:beta-xylosidase
MKHWEIIADDLSKAGWSWGWVSAVDCNGQTIWIADAHRDDGKRFVVHADEKLTAFLELESAIRDGCEFFLTTEQIFCKLGGAKRI